MRNRLVGITAPGFAAAFAYDALGRRTGKTVQGITTNYLYDGLNPLQEKAGASVTANILSGLGIDEYFTRTDSTGTRTVLPDALGSTLALTDSTGTLTTQYTYEPFGNTTPLGATSTNSFQYTGRENDGTGLEYYRARYYSPRLQRFIAEDPIGFAGGDTNVYSYVGNSPLNANDPSGLYHRDVHYDLTLWLAAQAGFSAGSAANIAAANQGLDDNWGTNAKYNLFAAAYWHLVNDAQLNLLKQQANDHQSLGQYLHALQDSYSHDGYWPAWPGHLFASLFGTDPDNVCNDLDKALEMARDTYHQLRAYRMLKSGGQIPSSFDDQMVGRKIRKLGNCGAGG